MTEGSRRPERRSEDTRLYVLERDLSRMLEEQKSTNQKLDRAIETLNAIQAEPEQFPAGRALLRRAERNSERIDKLDGEMDSMQAWRNEMNGVAKFTRYVQVIFGLAIAAITIIQLARN